MRWNACKQEDTYKMSHEMLTHFVPQQSGVLIIQYKIETLNIRSKGEVEFVEKSLNLESIFDSDFLSDFTIRVQHQKFKVHKVVLAVRSPVFHAMFQQKYCENLTNEIEISSFKPEMIYEMLRCIYTGRVKRMQVHSRDLLAAADKYEIEGLKIICEQRFSENLSVGNLNEMPCLSTLYSADQLEKCVHQFMRNVYLC